MAKALHPGHAADAGLLASMAATAGVSASLESLHAQNGFAAATSSTTGDWAAALDGLGEWTPITRMTVKAPSTVKKGKRAKVKVVVRAADGVAVTGQVRIAIKGGKTLTGTVRNGKVVVRLPKARKKMRLTVTYTGSDLAEPASERLRIKVRRR